MTFLPTSIKQWLMILFKIPLSQWGDFLPLIFEYSEISAVFLWVRTVLPHNRKRPRDEEGSVLQGLHPLLSAVRIIVSKAMRFLLGKMIYVTLMQGENKIIHITVEVNLKYIMLTERSKTQKVTYYLVTFT